MTVQSLPSARCRRLLMELSRYLDGDLTSARARKIEQHIGACECCGTLAARLRRTMAACRAEGKKPPPRQVMLRAAARIRALMAPEGPRPKTIARRRNAGRSAGARSRI